MFKGGFPPKAWGDGHDRRGFHNCWWVPSVRLLYSTGLARYFRTPLGFREGLDTFSRAMAEQISAKPLLCVGAKAAVMVDVVINTKLRTTFSTPPPSSLSTSSNHAELPVQYF